MSSYARPWALCGGWAIDAWLGRISRDHGDVDLSVFDAHHQELTDHLAGWQLIAHTTDGADMEKGLWDGRRLPVPSHIHARAPEDAGPLPEDGVCDVEKGWWLDIQIDGVDGEDWVMRSEPRVAMPLRDAIRTTAWGLPMAVPEVLLFFKAGLPRRRDWRDFVALLPTLDARQIAWLRDVIEHTYPEHPWVDALEWAASR